MTLPWMPTKGPKTKRLAEARLRQLLFQGTYDDDTTFLEMARRQVPGSWKTLEMDVDTDEPKEKITLYLDRSVARMYRAMGAGYQARINRILATYMQMKIAENVALEIGMLEAIEEASADTRRPAGNPGLEARREALHDYWAYDQGVMDAIAKPKRMGGPPRGAAEEWPEAPPCL